MVVSWIYESKVCKNDFSKPRFRSWNVLLFILAFIAFWMPTLDGKMYFSVKDLIMNESGLTYCMVTPIIISILLLYYPHINKITLRVTSFVGFLFGVLNMITWFILNASFWWMGIIHIPLLIISCVGVVLSKKHANDFICKSQKNKFMKEFEKGVKVRNFTELETGIKEDFNND